jgi:hypothetical protein
VVIGVVNLFADFSTAGPCVYPASLGKAEVGTHRADVEFHVIEVILSAKIMKKISLLLGLTAALMAAKTSAQVELTITGSTAFRAITIDRVASLYDAGYTVVTNNLLLAPLRVVGE